MDLAGFRLFGTEARAFVLILGLAWSAAAQPASAAVRCPLTLYLEDPRIPPVLIGELDFHVLYAAPMPRFAGSGIGVECVNLAGKASSTFFDDDDGVLAVDLSSESGMSSLVQLLARCTTVSDAPPVANQFTVQIVEETTVGGAVVTPPVAVRILPPDAEECETLASTTSTTTSTSTTTVTTDTVSSTTTSTTSTTIDLPPATCGDPTRDGSVTATDALLTLNAAVGIVTCQACVCDVDGSSLVTASDALALLGFSVGQSFELQCEPCGPATTAVD